jgi:hypothetical protein
MIRVVSHSIASPKSKEVIHVSWPIGGPGACLAVGASQHGNGSRQKPCAKHIVKLILEYLGYALGAGRVDTCPCAWAAERQLVGTDAEDIAIALVAILDMSVKTTVHGVPEAP